MENKTENYYIMTGYIIQTRDKNGRTWKVSKAGAEMICCGIPVSCLDFEVCRPDLQHARVPYSCKCVDCA